MLPPGLAVLRKEVETRAQNEGDLFRALGDAWNSFFNEILPTLDAMLFCIKVCLLVRSSESELYCVYLALQSTIYFAEQGRAHHSPDVIDFFSRRGSSQNQF